MADSTIRIDLVSRMARASIDSAVHSAISRFEGELGEHRNLAADIAQAAAENAIEQFKALCNAELRLIEVYHNARAKMVLSGLPPRTMIHTDQQP